MTKQMISPFSLFLSLMKFEFVVEQAPRSTIKVLKWILTVEKEGNQILECRWTVGKMLPPVPKLSDLAIDHGASSLKHYYLIISFIP